ncbi:MAG: MBOAT family protein [Acidimicrobiales bacterium]
MTFNSLQYAVFLVLAVAVYWTIPSRFQNHWLLVCSYVFYAFWDVRFLALLGAASLVDFYVGIGIENSTDQRRRKRLLLVSLAWNIGILGFFKYTNFFLDSAVELARAVGFSAHRSSLNIILPVAISFFTFQSIAYTVTIYRGRMSAARNLVDFAVYVAFFPQLVAGPIEKPWHILPQFQSVRTRPSADQVSRGLLLIFCGLVKKVVIADTAATVANQVFGDPKGTHAVALVLGVYAFAVQIYFDFSAYTDIARGSARLLGIELIENFREPYLSRDPSEFWRRWHISLSEWLRDYVFIPLGGSKAGELLTYRNLFVTMLVGGLWHGASWTFVIWGAFHGLLLMAARRLFPRHDPERPIAARDIPAMIVTFHMVCLGWIFFRAATFSDAVAMISGILRFQGGHAPVEVALTPFLLVATLAFDLVRRRMRTGNLAVLTTPRVTGALVALGTIGLIVFSGSPPVQFVYLKF